MHAIYVIVQDGIVTNRVQAHEPRDATWIESDTAQIGDLWDGSVFAKPPAKPPVPPSAVRLRNLLLALVDAGLLDNLKAAVAGLGPAARARAEIELQAGGDVPRDGVFVKALRSMLALSQNEVDELFMAAQRQPD